MSKYADYLKERDGLEVYENDWGFVSYSFQPDINALYLAELYVVPEKRNTSVAYRLFERVVDLAQAEGYSNILGSIDTDTNGHELSEKLMIKKGFTFYKRIGNLIYYMLKI